MISITLNGRNIEVSENENLLEIAKAYGINIPTFCYDKQLKNFSGCRICVVEIEGRKNLAAACSTMPTEGMIVKTHSEMVIKARKDILSLLIANHPKDCLTCPKTGDCKLQEYCFEYGVKDSPYIGDSKCYIIDDSNPAFIRDMNKCILCGKCVAVCRDIQVTGTIDFVGRGFYTKVTTAFDKDINTENCRLCGQCVSVCPTGALINKQLKNIRPWNIKKIRTTCPLCGVGCNFDLNVVDNKVIGVTPNEEATVNKTSLCVKGRYHVDFINNPDRITKPLIKRNGIFEEATFGEAYNYIIPKLKAIKIENGPDAITGLSSARCTNEDNFVFQKLFRVALGTNNIDHCARTWHAPTVAGLATTLGSGAMTNSISEIADGYDVFFIIGSNTTESHPIIGNKMKQAIKNGTKAIVIDPRKTELAKMAEYWLPLNPGTDAALINGLMYIIIKNNWHKKDYIKERCIGFDAIEELVKNYTPEKVNIITSISEDMLYNVAKLYATTEKAGIYYTLGITEHTTGTDNVMNLANLAMITGHIGIKNGGINPLRGQNNVQGSCDMGTLPNYYPGYQDIDDKNKRKWFESKWGIILNPNNGLRIPDMLDKAIKGEVKAMYVMGEDPVLTDPDTNHVKKALKSLDLLIVQDLFMSETAKEADVILPSNCYAEKDGTFTNTERRVQRVRKAVDYPKGCKNEWNILVDIAKQLGAKGFDYEKSEDIFNEIKETTPQYAGITYERINQDGIQWPCLSENHPGTPVLHIDQFAQGKGIMVPVEYKPPAELVNKEYPILLNTGRMLYHYNISTRTSKVLNKIKPHEEAEINPKDALAYGLDKNSIIRVTSRRGSITTRIKITDRVSCGSIFMTFHYKESPVNELTNAAADPITKTAEYKVAAVRIEKIETEEV